MKSAHHEIAGDESNRKQVLAPSWCYRECKFHCSCWVL